MKTQDASLPAPLPSADMTLSDEVVFHYRDTDGNPSQTGASLAMGLLYAANAMRADEPFALGYPGDRLGRLARREGTAVVLHRDVAETFNRMVTFLDDYTRAVIEQIRGADSRAENGAPSDGSPAPETVDNNSPVAA